MSHLTKRTTILVILACMILISSYFIFVNNKAKDEIIVRSSSAWIYPYSSAEELLNSKNIHLVVEATVLPNSVPYKITYEEPTKIVLNRTLTDIRVERILKNTRGDVQASQVIPIIETTAFFQDEKLGKVETPLEDYRKAQSGLKYLFLLSWNSQEQKYHVAAAHFGKYNLDSKDNREIAVEKVNERYAMVKKDILVNANSILSK
ncbi:MAG: hypothetical protein K0Q73_6993 [Paenibacillus sp.]|jgi:hypothetical protein|nr:hypothetical protein [Paenibacillus sp.]